MNNLTIQPGFYAEVTDLILPYPVLHFIPTLKMKNDYIRFKPMEKIRSDS